MKFAYIVAATALALLAAVPAIADDTANIQVVQAYYTAVNTGDLDQAMTFIADDAVFINPTGTYTGIEAVRKSLAQVVSDHLTFDLSNFKDADGRVTYDYTVKIDGAAIESGTTGLTWVKAGKVVFDGTTDTEAFWKH
jgi:ketosteroid isomerase-like protein